MSLPLFVLTAVLLVAVWWLWRMRRSASVTETERASPASRKKTAYHAVSIKHARDACVAAKALSGRRFLATAAPQLPLPDCDAKQCKCQFLHHQDRRSGNDRRSPFGSGRGMDATGSFKPDNRIGRDRRKNNDYS